MNQALAGAAFGAIVMFLSGCGGEEQEANQTISKAEGKILPRSVADDMLPYDTLRSQPPLAKPKDGKTSSRAEGPAGADEEAGTGEPESAGDEAETMPGAE